MERGVYFDAWFPRQHCYHPSLPPRRLRMLDDLADYHATTLVWAALGYFDRVRCVPIAIAAVYWYFVTVIWIWVFFTLTCTPYFF